MHYRQLVLVATLGLLPSSILEPASRLLFEASNKNFYPYSWGKTQL